MRIKSLQLLCSHAREIAIYAAVVLLFLYFLISVSPALAATIDLQIPIGTYKSIASFPEYIKKIYNFGVAGAGILAVIMMMVGGFIWLTAAGNVNQIGTAKSFISGAVLGLILALTSYLILSTINPKLVNLKMPEIAGIERVATEGCNWQDTCDLGYAEKDKSYCSTPEPEGQKCCCEEREELGFCFNQMINSAHCLELTEQECACPPVEEGEVVCYEDYIWTTKQKDCESYIKIQKTWYRQRGAKW